MTAEENIMNNVPLLPLPRTLRHPDDADLAEHVKAYARANLAHATAAKDAEIARWKDAAEMQSAITKALLPYQDEAVAGRAEIEALRAEVERLTGYVRGWEQNYHDEKARAERLEEALRDARSYIDVAENPLIIAAIDAAIDKARGI